MARHLIYHICPIGNWRENLALLQKYGSVFDGHRICAVALDKNTPPLESIKKELSFFTKILPIANNIQLREAATLKNLLAALAELTKDGICFYGHTKGTSHVNGPKERAVKLWTRGCYEKNLGDMEKVDRMMKAFPICGAFKRYGYWPNLGRESTWHYSGTFYWFDVKEMFSRNWQSAIRPTRYGAEAFPSLVFSKGEAGVLSHDDFGDGYNLDYMQKVMGVKKETTREKVSVVITCYDRAADLPLIVTSLRSQHTNIIAKDSNTGAPVRWGKGELCDWPLEILAVCDGKYNGLIYDDEICYNKLIECPRGPGNVHHTRGTGIAAATGDWIVLTNDDNYYCAGWLDLVTKEIAPNVGMITWDCVNNYWGWTNGGGTKLQRGHIDMMSGMVKASIAKKVGFPFKNFDGDFDYFDACAKEAARLGLAIVHLNQTLCVHN